VHELRERRGFERSDRTGETRQDRRPRARDALRAAATRY
jgi:hypothetical protein